MVLDEDVLDGRVDVGVHVVNLPVERQCKLSASIEAFEELNSVRAEDSMENRQEREHHHQEPPR